MKRANPEMTELPFKPFVGDDLDAEAGQSLVVMHRRGEVDDRCDAEIPQDLRADADLAPLPVAVGFRGLGLAQWCDGHAGRTVTQVDQHAASGALEMIEHHLHAGWTGEQVL